MCESLLACLGKGFRGEAREPDGERSVGDGRENSDVLNRTRMKESGTQSTVGCFLPEEVDGGKSNERMEVQRTMRPAESERRSRPARELTP